MGNKLGCCFYSSPQPPRKADDRNTVSVSRLQEVRGEPGREESTNNLQHISEREPEDWQADPSLHPKAETIFMERSRAAIHEGLERRRSQIHVSLQRVLVKQWNS